MKKIIRNNKWCSNKWCSNKWYNNKLDFSINVIFDVGHNKIKVIIQCDIETRIKDSFEKFSNKIGKSKNSFTFWKDDIKLALDDVRKIKIIIYDLGNL